MPRAARACSVLAIIARLLAIVVAFVVVAMAVPVSTTRPYVMLAQNVLTGIIPNSIFGLFVAETPLDGVFRGDFAIFSVILFIVDWALMRVSASLR